MAGKELILRNLKQRGFEPYYFETREEALNKLLEMIPSDRTIGFGGSMTLEALKVKEMLLERGNSVYDRAKAETPEEAQEIMRNALLSDVFLMSTNSMTEDGELFNIDGRGNRLAALIYGPKEVFIVLGTNKIVKNLDEAYKRVRHTVAPMNAKRLGSKTPCAVTGHCTECKGSNSICCHMLTTRNSFIPGRIKIFIINEELGF